MILVTGANGFIGQAVCSHLAADGFKVRKAVRNRKNAGIPAHDTVLVEDIGPETDWTGALKGISTVIHLAARVHIMRDTSTDPLAEFRKVNVSGTRKLAETAALMGVKRIIFISSVKVNGERTTEKPFTEKDTPGPSDPYAISKWEAEQALAEISSEKKIETVIIRPPLVYGPGVGANFLRLIKIIDMGIPLPFEGVKNLRSMIYLGNLADAVVKCVTHNKAAGEVFLVSDGRDLSLPELIFVISNALGKKARLFPFPGLLLKTAGRFTGKYEEVRRLLDSLRVDSSKIRSALNWAPPYFLDEGLSEAMRWYKSL